MEIINLSAEVSALKVLFANFHRIMQYAGMPKYSIEDLATDHSPRLQTRRIERQSGDTTRVNGNGLCNRVPHVTWNYVMKV